jgi:hypothetical protein
MWHSFDRINAIIGFISAVIGIVAAGFAMAGWRKARSIRAAQEEQERRRAERIRLILVRESDHETHQLGYQPRRDQASRGEIMGILGMYYGQPRFEPSRLVPILENGDFEQMIAGEANALHITVSDGEYARFVKKDSELGEAPGTPIVLRPVD